VVTAEEKGSASAMFAKERHSRHSELLTFLMGIIADVAHAMVQGRQMLGMYQTAKMPNPS